jgi:hypothetical protein
MSYFIFDMDETLAELYSVYYFIASLRLNETYKEDNKYDVLSDTLLKKLNNAYDIFVDDVFQQEISSNPLGILRPGILKIMEKLRELQINGRIKNVIIYSNNGHLESLEFIRDLIHKYVKSNELIKECIHWNHHMRKEERTIKPGMANKTWNVLKNIMVKGNCKASPNIEPKDVYFFDDLDHHDLQRNLGGNYYKVPGYNFKASFDRLAVIYRKALKEANIDKKDIENDIIELFVRSNIEYQKIMEMEGLEGILNLFKSKTKGTANTEDRVPQGEDEGIRMMEEAISRVERNEGGGRKKRRVVEMTKKKKLRRNRISRSRKN